MNDVHREDDRAPALKRAVRRFVRTLAGTNRRAKHLLAPFILGLALLPAGQALAADCVWLGNSSEWFDGANWATCPSGIPTASDAVAIDKLSSLGPRIGPAESAQSGNVFLRYGGELTIDGLLASQAGLIADLDHPTDVTTVTVRGEDARWALGDFLSVGRKGIGVLEITDGGEVANSGAGYVGEFAGSEGDVTVDGKGSHWNNGDKLLVGVLGTGTLNISNGGEVTDGSEGIIGDQASGSGVVTVDDATWASDGLIYVGNHGTGRLDVGNGGKVADTYGTAGFYADGHGEINVDGSGSTWSNSEEINIGNHGDGRLAVTGGGLVTGGSQSRVGNYADGVGEAVVSDAGSLWSNAGPLYVGRQGTGTLTLSDGGEVELGSGNGALVVADGAGSTGTVNIGAAAGDDPAAPGTLAAGSLLFGSGDGTLVFNHTDDGDYTFSTNIFGKGTIVQESGSTHYTGNGVAFSGILLVRDGDFDVEGQLGGEIRLEDSASMVVHTPLNVTRSVLSVSGGGSLFKTGAGNLDLTGWDGSGTFPSSTLSGTMTVLGGTMFTDIINKDTTFSIGGCVDTGSGLPDACNETPSPSVKIPGLTGVTACVGGMPSIGAMFMYQDGCVSPGHSIGTFRVADTWEMDPGAIYVVELKGGGTTPGVHNDLMEVAGTAVLKDGARIHVMPENGSDDGATDYADGSRYVIIDAGTLVVEGATDITDTFAYLNFTGDHDAQRFYLIGHLGSDSFALDGMTRNQLATADAAFALGAGSDIYDQVLNLGEAQARAAMNALSGEIHASERAALIEDSRFVRNAANDRIRAAFASAGATRAPVLAFGPGGAPALVAPDDAGPVFWVHGFGAWGSTEGDGNAVSLDRSAGGLLFGADALAGGWRIGALAGYSHSTLGIDDRASTASSNDYHLGIYAGTTWGPVALRTGAAYSFHDIETGRFVANPGLAGTLTSDHGTDTFQAFGELGYDIDLRPGTSIEPFANLAHVHLSTGGFSEEGGAAALSVRGGSSDVTFTTLGIRGEHALQLGTVDARLRGMVGWRHAFGDTTPESIHAFAGGGPFKIAGAPVAGDSAVIVSGIELDLTPAATVGVSYHGEIASDAYDHGFSANLAVTF